MMRPPSRRNSEAYGQRASLHGSVRMDRSREHSLRKGMNDALAYFQGKLSLDENGKTKYEIKQRQRVLAVALLCLAALAVVVVMVFMAVRTGKAADRLETGIPMPKEVKDIDESVPIPKPDLSHLRSAKNPYRPKSEVPLPKVECHNANCDCDTKHKALFTPEELQMCLKNGMTIGDDFVEWTRLNRGDDVKFSFKMHNGKRTLWMHFEEPIYKEVFNGTVSHVRLYKDYSKRKSSFGGKHRLQIRAVYNRLKDDGTPSAHDDTYLSGFMNPESDATKCAWKKFKELCERCHIKCVIE